MCLCIKNNPNFGLFLWGTRYFSWPRRASRASTCGYLCSEAGGPPVDDLVASGRKLEFTGFADASVAEDHSATVSVVLELDAQLVAEQRPADVGGAVLLDLADGQNDPIKQLDSPVRKRWNIVDDSAVFSRFGKLVSFLLRLLAGPTRHFPC